MTAAQYNAHLLANPGCAKHSGRSAARTGSGYRKGTPGGLGEVRVRRASPEEDLHRLVFDWIFAMQSAHPVLRFMMHVPNGGVRSKGEAGKLKAMGVRKGISDVICPFTSGSFKGFACELKAPKGRCTPEQTDYLEEAKSDGWLTGVCFSLDEFVVMAQAYLGVAVGSLVPATAPADVSSVQG